jgi:hypothetical protein
MGGPAAIETIETAAASPSNSSGVLADLISGCNLRRSLQPAPSVAPAIWFEALASDRIEVLARRASGAAEKSSNSDPQVAQQI